MLRKPLSFIFRLTRHPSLPFRPLRQINVGVANPPTPPAVPPSTQDLSARDEDALHCEQT